MVASINTINTHFIIFCINICNAEIIYENIFDMLLCVFDKKQHIPTNSVYLHIHV